MIERIQGIIDHYGLNIRRFAHSCGIHQVTLCNQLNRKRSLSLETVLAICRTYGHEISIDWLMLGCGQMLRVNNIDRVTVPSQKQAISDTEKEKQAALTLLKKMNKQYETSTRIMTELLRMLEKENV